MKEITKQRIERAVKVISTIAAATILALMLLALFSSMARAAASDLAVEYHCDDQQVFTVNYVLGARVAQYGGQSWTLKQITDGIGYHDDGSHYPTTQYQFSHGRLDLYFVTGKNKTGLGALLIPNSDDFLYCEASSAAK